MGIFKKLCMASMLGVMLTVPTYATVVTGSQSDVNMELKYPLVYTNNMFAQKAINTDIANYVLYAKSVYYDQHSYQVKQKLIFFFYLQYTFPSFVPIVFSFP